MQWRRKSAGRERVHIYLRQNGQPARVKMDTALRPSATQLTLWPAVLPHPLSCRSPHSGLSGTINYIFKKIQRYFWLRAHDVPSALSYCLSSCCRSTCGEDQEAVQAQKIWKKSIMLVWRAAANHRWSLTYSHRMSWLCVWFSVFLALNWFWPTRNPLIKTVLGFFI